MRVQPGQHLSQEGVDLARRVGNEIGPFDCTITSALHRAYETAIAMGFAVNDQLEELNTTGAAVEGEVAWDAGFAAFAEAIQRGGAAAQFASGQAILWQTIIESVPEGGAALLITHGGIVEAGAVACFPDADHSQWGAYCGYCEGVRLGFEDGQFVTVEILRV